MALCGTFAEAASFQLTPSTLSVGLGGTGGFGFSFTNDASGYAVFAETALTQLTGTFGSFNDFIGGQADLVIVAPGGTATQSYDPVKGTGAGSFTLLLSPPGGKVNGMLSLFYDVFSVSPNDPKFNSLTDYVDSKEVTGAVTLVELTATAAPEPSEFALAAAGLLLLAVGRRRRCVQR
jgi:MYXO-CTERM domain-containing protein